MNGNTTAHSRPGSLPKLPATLAIKTTGRLTYMHPTAGGEFQLYDVPVSRLCGARAVAPTSGTAQVAGITLTTASSATGSWAVTLAHPLLAAPIAVTVPIAVAVTTAANQALAIRAALAAAIAANSVAAAKLTSTGSGATFSVTAKDAAADSDAFTLTAVQTGVTDTTQADANTTGVLGTVPEFLGQAAIAANVVKIATDLRLNTWTQVSN